MGDVGGMGSNPLQRIRVPILSLFLSNGDTNVQICLNGLSYRLFFQPIFYWSIGPSGQ